MNIPNSAIKQMIVALAIAAATAAAAGEIEIETVSVGDPGNAGDTTGCGAVSYSYNIGKYEVTAGQYAVFLNAVAAEDTHGLYNPEMANRQSGCGISRSGTLGKFTYTVVPEFLNRPVNFVAFGDACRFANWLSNGQPAGAQDDTTTEDGTYSLRGYDGGGIRRNASWKWAVTGDNEWYKAAYYKGGGKNSGYWLYPTQSNKPPGSDKNDPDGNNANWNPETPKNPIWSTLVGNYRNSESPYGTFDQGGNVIEWIDDWVRGEGSQAVRRTRGGSFADAWGTNFLRKEMPKDVWNGGWELAVIGFRVTKSIHPELAPAAHGMRSPPAALSSSQAGAPAAKTLLSSYLLEPNYRGWMYGEWPAALRLRLFVADWDRSLKKEDLRLRALLTGSEGKELLDISREVETGVRDWSIQKSGRLAPGDYRLQISVLDRRNGRVLSVSEHSLVQWKGESPDARCWIDRHQRLIVDGKPFFPIGMFAEFPGTKDLQRISDAGFNCLMPYYLYGQTGQTIEIQKRYLEDSERFGIKTIYSTKDIYPDWAITHLERLHGWKGKEAILRGLVETFRDNPNIIAWYINDEMGVAEVHKVLEHYRVTRSVDQGRPIWMCDFRPEAMRQFWGTADVFGVDHYPIAWLPIESVGKASAQARSQLFSARPRWDVPQAHNLQIYSPGATTARPPSREEMRNMCYQFLCNGASGLVLFCYDDLKRDPKGTFDERWRDVRKVAAELREITPILLSVDEPLSIKVEGASVRWFHKAHNNVTHVFLVNSGRAPVSARLTIPKRGLQLTVDGAARGVSSESGSVPPIDLPVIGVCHVRIRH